MKAAVRRKYCSPKQILLENIQKPEPKENEVLIQVFATTVNRTDCANLTAKPFIMRFVLGFFRPKKVILGTDFAGKIVALGKSVSSFKVDDKVFGLVDAGIGSQAEFLTISADQIFRIPEKQDSKIAVASLEGAHYAYAFIHKVKIESGQKVLINGATGAIGSALLQFVKQYDVYLAVTCNTMNMPLIKSLGADKVYDYSKEDFTKGSETFDFIFDAVGKSTFGKCKRLLSANGVYISSELGPFAQNVFFALLSPFFKKKVVFPIPFSTQKTIPFISTLLAEGKFKPVIDRVYALAEISKAYDYVISGEKTGNVVLKINE